MKDIGIPAFAVHPGEMLVEEFMKPLKITQAALAEHIGVSARRVNEVCRGRRAITAETAILLGKAFGMPAKYWMDLQATYELTLARQKHAKLEEVGPIKASA